MTRSHDELREALGAYALGQLDDDLLVEVQQHLTTCDACTAELAEIQPLVGALRRVDVHDVHPVGITPPAELDARIRSALGDLSSAPAAASAGRARRWAPVAGAAALAAAAAAVVATVVVRDDSPAPPVIAVPRVQAVDGVTASAGLVDHTWGVEIKLQATGLAPGERFSMWVVGDDGTSHEAGEFVGVADATITCDMSSSVLLDDAASFRVVDAEGDEVIAGAMPS